jgi:hypothetical protein
MGLRGLDTLKIGLVNAIFILLFPLLTGRSKINTFLFVADRCHGISAGDLIAFSVLFAGSRPTLLKNGVDPSLVELFPNSRYPAVPDPVSIKRQVDPALFRHLRADTRPQIYNGVLDDGFIDSESSKRGVVSGQHHQFPASEDSVDVGVPAGITDNKHVVDDSKTPFLKVPPEYIVKLVSSSHMLIF